MEKGCRLIEEGIMMKACRLLGSFLLFLFFAAVLAIPTYATEGILFEDDFESGDTSNWELGAGWDVVSIDGTKALKGVQHEWAKLNTSYFGDDFRVELRMKMVSGGTHLNFRIGNIGRYFISVEEQGTTLSKQIWPNTFFEGIESSQSKHPPNKWHDIEIRGENDTVRVFVNGTEEITYADPDPLIGGSFSIETLDNSEAYFDDIIIYGQLPEEFAPWTYTGGPLGGLGYDIRMVPGNAQKMYVTDAYAGIFISTNGGQTWSASSEGISKSGTTSDAIPTFCLTIDPTNPNIIWTGLDGIGGVFKSVDGGSSWDKTENGVVESVGLTLRGFTVDPTNPETVYMAGELASHVWAGKNMVGREFDMVGGVVYKTDNRGQTWKKIWQGDNLARYIWINPYDTNMIYVSTGIFDREAANSDPVKGIPGGEGVLKSTDGGATWTYVNNGLGNLYVGSLFMHPENPDILLAGTGNNQYFNNAGIYLSTNGGMDWELKLSGDNITSVEFSESNPNIAYAGSNNAIYRSDDAGQNWKKVIGDPAAGWGPVGVRAGFPIDMQVDPNQPDRIFINNYGGGNFLSNDGGKTWASASKGYTGAQVRDVAVDPDAPGRLFAAARSGIYVSINGGGSWIGLSLPPVQVLEWNNVAMDPGDPMHIIASHNYYWELAQSFDGGVTWEQYGDNLGLSDGLAWRSIVFAPSDSSIVYAGTGAFFSAGAFDETIPAKGLAKSLDGGKKWQWINSGLASDAHVTDIAVDHLNPNIVYAATANHGVLKSTNGGTNWSAIGVGLPSSNAALSVAVHPNDPNTIFSGFQEGAVYKSTDGGTSWSFKASGLNPEATVTDIVFDPTDSSIVYASDLLSGVYRSTNSGESWTAINENLLMKAVNALAITKNGKHIYAASEGGGVFRLDVDEFPPQASPELAPQIDLDDGDSSPTAPSLSVSTQGVTVAITWTATDNTDGYTLYYAPPDISYIGDIDVGKQTNISFDLWKGAAFYLAVKAYNSAGSSEYSNIVSFSIP